MFVVDTNVLVYAANSAVAEHLRCRELVERWREGAEPWGTTWNVIYEFARVVTHPRVLSRPFTGAQAWSFVEALLAAPTFRIVAETERHGHFAARTVAEVPLLAGNLFHDAHTAVAMREHGIRRLWTRDADFHRFTFVDPIDPMLPDA